MPSLPSHLLAFARLGRPHFLFGGVVLYAIGAAVAAQQRALNVGAYFWGQAAITATQLMTHYSNEYFDLAADRANATPSRWSGGSRVLPRGELPPRVALVTAVILAATALALDLFVGFHVTENRAVFPLLVIALALSWEYSAPPLRLHSRGLGAFTTALIVTMLTPLVACSLQVPRSVLPTVLAALPLVCAQVAMILVVDFPDAEGDRAVGKKTLAVRFGGLAAARLCGIAICAPYLALPLLAFAGLPARTIFAVASTAPLAALLLASLVRGDWEQPTRWTRLTWLSVAWFGVLAMAELVSSVSLAAER